MASYLIGKLIERAARAHNHQQSQSNYAGSYGPSVTPNFVQPSAISNSISQYNYQGGYSHSPQSPPYLQKFQNSVSPPNYHSVSQIPSPHYASPPRSQAETMTVQGGNSSYEGARSGQLFSPPPPATRNQQFWGKLITEQKTASPTLVAYVTSLYNYLDQNVAPCNQGGLSPEKIGLLGELQGYYGDAGLYGQMKTAASYSGQGAAFIDSQFTLVYNSYSLPYITMLRAATAFPPPTTTAAAFLSSFLTPQASSMPLLTLSGLMTWFILNILRQPHQEWVCMSKVLAAVQLLSPGEGTPLPRTVDRSAFPEYEDEAAQRKHELCEGNMRRRNEFDAANLNAAARRSDLSAARIRDDAVWGYEVNGRREYWL